MMNLNKIRNLSMNNIKHVWTLRKFAFRRGLYWRLDSDDHNAIEMMLDYVYERWQYPVLVEWLSNIRDNLVKLAHTTSRLFSKHLIRAAEKGFRRVNSMSEFARKIVREWATPDFLCYYGSAAP